METTSLYRPTSPEQLNDHIVGKIEVIARFGQDAE